jgi:hypothetical protein
VNVHETDIPLAALDTADVATVKSASEREPFLTEPALTPKLPHASAKANQDPTPLHPGRIER